MEVDLLRSSHGEAAHDLGSVGKGCDVGAVRLRGDVDGSGVVVWQDSDGRWRVRPVGEAHRFYLDVDTTEPPGELILVPVVVAGL